MKDAERISNRQYLAFILAGGTGKSPFRLISCAVDEAGQVVFSQAVEQYCEAGGGYDISISAPGGKFEKWMGNGSDYVAIRFAEKPGEGEANTVPAIPLTPAEVLESFQRWKSGPGVRETMTDTGGVIVREYLPDQEAEQSAPVSTTKQ